MAPESPSSGRGDGSSGPQADPWLAFGYVIAGVMLYGAIGWGLDRWLGTAYLVVVGIVGGAALGTYLTWKRFQVPPDQPRE